MSEIWKDIEGYEGKYQVSNLGRVKSLNYKRTGKERVIRLNFNNGGYLLVDLWKNGKGKKYTIHRLVAQAFISNPCNKPCVDHINTIQTDNRVENLRWVSYKENSNNVLTKEHISISLIGNQHLSKKVICENTIYDSLTQCAEHYKVNASTMCNWLAGRYKMRADFQAKGLRYYIEE